MFMTKNRELLMQLKAEVETLKTALIIMDPQVSTSADAYEGLVKQVAFGASSRRAHLVQLAQFAQELQHGAKPDDLVHLVNQWMHQAGLATVTEPKPELFDILGGVPEASRLQVDSAAFVDLATGALVASGTAHWLALVAEETTESSSAIPDMTEEAAESSSVTPDKTEEAIA
jgi:hypothetical protein